MSTFVKKNQLFYGDRLMKKPETKNSERTRLNFVWFGIKTRCLDTDHPSFYSYGGRGISICDEWRYSFEAFYQWAITSGAKRGLQIDRTDNNKGYYPENCRWITPTENSRNRRDNHLVTAFGETKCIQAWVEDARCNTTKQALRQRISLGWPPEDAITTPQKTYTGEYTNRRKAQMQRMEQRRAMLASGMKHCPMCDQHLPLTSFSVACGYCKPCKAKYYHARRTKQKTTP